MASLPAVRTIPDLLTLTSALYPDLPVINCDGTQLRYRQLKDSSDATAAVLYRFGVRKGDRVCLFVDNSAELCDAYFGILSVGALYTPLRPLLTRDDLAYMLEDTTPTCLIVDQALMGRALDFLAVSPPALKAALPVLWVANSRASPLSPSDISAAKHGVRSITNFQDEKAAIAAEAAVLEGILSEITEIPKAPGDLAMILYTSGTTGRPKGVLSTHGACMSHCNMPAFAETIAVLKKGPAHLGEARKVFETRLSAGPRPPVGLFDRPLCPLALTTVPIFILMNSVAYAATLTLLKWPGYLDVPQVLRVLQAGECTVTWLNPGMLVEVFRHPIAAEFPPGSFPHLKQLIVAGAKCSVAVQRSAASFFRCGILQIYGMTETCGGGTFLLPTDHVDPAEYPTDHPAVRRLNSCGRSPPGVSVRIVDPNTLKFLPPNAEGEVVIGGPKVMVGYWNNPTATASVLVDIRDDATGATQRFMRSADIGKIDEDGYLFLLGRIKDIVNLGSAFSFSCGEVEEAIMSEVPGVSECAVAGVPSAAGDECWAWIVLRAGADASLYTVPWVGDKLAGNGKLSRVKVPSRVVLLPKLPKNDSGKVVKPVLIQSALAPPSSAL